MAIVISTRFFKIKFKKNALRHCDQVCDDIEPRGNAYINNIDFRMFGAKTKKKAPN
jgi:hypothetical protein